MNKTSNIYKYVDLTNVSVEEFEGKKKYISTGNSDSFDDAIKVTYNNRPARANVQGKETDILFAKMAETNKVIHLDGISSNYIYSTGFFCINSKIINNKYLFYLISSYEFNEEKNSWSFGTTQVALNNDNFKKIRVEFVKDVLLQKRIAVFLEEKTKIIDELIRNQQEQIRKLVDYKKTVIGEIITKGINLKTKMKSTGIYWIKETPFTWQTLRLKDLLKQPLFYGSNKSGSKYEEKFPRYIRITDIQDDELTTETSNMQSYTHDDADKYFVKKGDILFARSGATVGKTYFVQKEDENNVFAGYLINGRFDETKVNQEYIYLYTKSSVWDIWKEYIFIQSTIQNISAEKYNQFQLVIPSLSEQNEIVKHVKTKVEKIDALIAVKKKKTQKLMDYKEALIYEYVSGKKKI